ncbi:hypothetical protein CSB45_13765 [candidate division KSB3 bacterium]|uniref:starch synthase n=1 Tax=candidate division KSB3 bacterium TaxID=2044937 RepID=A0A2G6E1A6_9BACT|nr:MAG: hypothetical protein CSB45_13765 [candidate division KSB3 bacterium]PIE28525.1 MAG: hypothetical protein CSA57_13555 [candidate division KSB3 bacterium]
MEATVVFISFETEFSSYGGLGAVMNILPKEMGADACCVMAPFFDRLIDLDALKTQGKIQEFSTLFSYFVVIRGRSYCVDLIEVVNGHGLRHYFLSSAQFFNVPENPYVNPCDPERPLDPYRNPSNPEKLTEDALFFSTAVPSALAELVKEGRIPSRDLILHLQDWETAAVAKACRVVKSSPAIRSMKCVLTIHNPYDKPLSDVNSSLVLDFAAYLGFQKFHSILAQVIPILGAPVSTVSRNFAYELRNEVLYTQIFCPHLQEAFKEKKLLGIDNGIFGASDFPFSKTALKHAKNADFEKIQQEKWRRREKLAEVMDTYLRKLTADGKQQSWGQEIDISDPARPIFLVLGRDDPRQKGFEVIVEAIRTLPQGQARFIFTPMPGDEGVAGLNFLHELARERGNEVIVFPFRVEKTVFQALQKGSSFMVMGSLYEPFGAANEAYLSGMPVVARATGGLVQQVVPHKRCLKDESILSSYGRQLLQRYHKNNAAPTGILFREQVSFADEVEGWRRVVDCGYWAYNPKGDRVVDRRGLVLFQDMVRSAEKAFELAISLYQRQLQYAEMVYNGWLMLEQFGWDRAIAEYRSMLYQA